MYDFLKYSKNRDTFNAWEKTGLLNGLEEHTAQECVKLLENQRLVNEKEGINSSFKRISIPVLRRLIQQLPELKAIDCIDENWHKVTEFSFPVALPVNLEEEVECTATLVEAIASFITKNNYPYVGGLDVKNAV